LLFFPAATAAAMITKIIAPAEAAWKAQKIAYAIKIAPERLLVKGALRKALIMGATAAAAMMMKRIRHAPQKAR